MLGTVADILRALQKHEERQLSIQNISHGPTIGAMYEGLSRTILAQMVPPQLRLKLVQGFVSGPAGTLSTQIDCMLVVGDGTSVPHTDSFVWPVQKVLAVVEVKKNLHTAELQASYNVMSSVLAQFHSYVVDGINDRSVNIRFCELMGRFPTDDVADQACLTYFAHDYQAPIRIVLAYDGFVTETSLRDGFLRHLSERLLVRRPIICPYEFPNLIICGENTVLRYNGHPYLRVAEKNGIWPLLATSSANPLHFVIQTLWYRFATDFAFPYPFDSSVAIARTTPFLATRFFKGHDGLLGIEYAKCVSQPVEANPGTVDWKPITLSLEEWLLLRVIQIRGLANANAPELLKWCAKNRINLADARQKLEDERLIVEKEGQLVCFREKLYTIVANGRLMTAFEEDRERLNLIARRSGKETTEARLRSIALNKKLEQGIKSWYLISGDTRNPANQGLGRYRPIEGIP
jgi:hypothetical protein